MHTKIENGCNKCLKPYSFRGGFAPLAPYQGFALVPLGALSGPQTPRPIILHPPFLIPGYGPGVFVKSGWSSYVCLKIELIFIYVDNYRGCQKWVAIFGSGSNDLLLTNQWKSLSPIHFVKIWLSYFLGNEFLVKMYKLSQNYTFKIDTISTIMYIWSK